MEKKAPAMTWNNTLYNHGMKVNHMDDFIPIAKQLCYPYFCWNGRVYSTESGVCVGHVISNEIFPQ